MPAVQFLRALGEGGEGGDRVVQVRVVSVGPVQVLAVEREAQLPRKAFRAAAVIDRAGQLAVIGSTSAG
jgi:hypothetical protein